MRTAHSRGFAIRYEDSGGDGPPLVLVNGWSGPAREWAERGYVAPLVDRFRVLVVDSLGHGESGCPHDPDAYRFPDVAEDILCAVDDAGVERATFWGYSRGAMLVATVAAEHPERVHALILGGFHPRDGVVSDQVDPADEALQRGDWDAFWDVLGEPVSMEDRRYMEETSDPRAMAAVDIGMQRSAYIIPLERIKAPVLLYYGATETEESRPVGQALNVTPTILEGNHTHVEAFTEGATAALAPVQAFLDGVHDQR